MYGARQNIRLKEDFPVRWQIEEKDLQGLGRVKNISIKGLLLETDSAFHPVACDECLIRVVSIEQNSKIRIQHRGRIVWFKKNGGGIPGYLCGIEFIQPSDEFVKQLTKRIEEFQQKQGEATNINILNQYTS